MIKIKVPGSTANLGPGYDTLGLALNIYNTFGFNLDKIDDEENLVRLAYNKVFEYLNVEKIPVGIEISGDIPISRGLGSSSTCIVGGMLGANKILNEPLSIDELFNLASQMEGHPDNIAPAMFGGLNVSYMGDKIYREKINIKNDYDFIAVIPNFELSTEKARNVLPKTINIKDGIFNIAHVSLLISAFVNGYDSLISEGLKDKIHEPYRKMLIPNYDEIKKFSMNHNSLGVYLSGAGPTIMIINRKENNIKKELSIFLNNFEIKYDIKFLNIDNFGFKFI